jgi:DNA modification methylase
MPRPAPPTLVPETIEVPIVWIPLATLRPHPRNDGHHPPEELAHLKQSLTEHGVYRNVVIADDGTILAGHGVVQAAQELGHTQILARRMAYGPDDPQALKILVGDNHIARLRMQDDAALVTLLQDLAQHDPLALLGTGFDAHALEALVAEQGLGHGTENGNAGRDAEPQIDRAEELREQWGVEEGQVWVCGSHRVICGDCTDTAVVERLITSIVVDLVVTSPPYAVGKAYEKDRPFAAHLALLRGMADQCLAVLKPGGFLVTNFAEIAPQSHAGPLTGSDRQCLYLISKDYWDIFHVERQCDLYAQRVWYKPFNRLQQPFWTYHTSIPHHQEWEHVWTWRVPGGDDDTVYEWDVSVRAVWATHQEPTDDRPLTRHVAAFPVGIPERCVRAHSATGMTVYDPFLGSGTTLIACDNLGRVCYGCELDPSSVAVTLQRWADVTGKPPVRLA